MTTMIMMLYCNVNVEQSTVIKSSKITFFKMLEYNDAKDCGRIKPGIWDHFGCG